MMDDLNRWYENMTYQEAKDILREKLDYMKKNFIAAGYYMKYIRDHELFREDGYESIWEFAEDNYGIKKSTASRWMAMNDKFSQGGNSPVLAEEFRDFEKSQLQEMLYLDDKQIETVTPDMTVKEIREVRKPEEPTKELKKPDETDREYLKAAASHLIKSLHDWFFADFMNRVEQVDRSPVELKKKFGKNSRCWHFLTEKGVARINLFDDCVQIWDEENECIGDFDWFHLAAAIQSMWNVIAMENAQKSRQESVATSQQADDEPVVDMNPPEEVSDPEPEVITEENIEVVDVDEEEPAEELYEETSDQSDINLLKEELDKAKNKLDLMLSCCSENDILARKQKLLVGALAGMLCDLDAVDTPEPESLELPELPLMKNNDQRKEFLNRYQVWPVWFEVPEASEVYHRFDLPDGSSIVICEYHMWLSWKEEWSDENPDSIGTREYLLQPGYHYLEDCKTNTTTLVEHLKKVQKEGK